MTMPPDWWRDFFSGLAVDFWHAMATPQTTEAEVATLLRLASPQPGARVLDVPCGSGRHAHALAERGFDVTGQDGSAAFLALARERASPAKFCAGDMREPPNGPFDLACCLGNSFGYLGEDGDRAFLRAVHAALRPGGTFVLDATVLETLLPQLVPRRWYEAGGVLFLSQVAFDPVTGVLRSDYTMLRGAEREQRSAFVRVRSVRETLDLLLWAGFRTPVAQGDQGAPFALGTPRAWFTATA